MQKKKVFILLPDGVGLRNFAYTDFCGLATEMDFDITFWNDTPFELNQLGFREIKVENSRNHPFTSLLKKARVILELNQNIKKTNDPIYDSYRYPLLYTNAKESLKSLAIKGIVWLNSSSKGLERVRENILKYEQKTPFYERCLEVLQREKPDLVFCSNQRTVPVIAAIMAAKALGIPTVTFIFSWDNLPKGMMALETDFYFVWSDHMKSELLFYYPYIRENQVFITGTPQFEPHFNKSFLKTKAQFCMEYGLDPAKNYICFSGDDVTTSPYDPQYLEDTAKAVRELNSKGYNLGLVFRRSPVDFSNRYDGVIARNSDVITPIDPEWKKMGEGWNTILPTKEDMILLMNTISHTEAVINLGSSMVFDYVAQDKPCAFINYDIPEGKVPGWSVKKVYNFIHFRSMPDRNAVFWLNSPDQIAGQIARMLDDNGEVVAHAKNWFRKITLHPPQKASEQIWKSISGILNTK